MANKDIPFGLKVYNKRGGTEPGHIGTYAVLASDTTPLFAGDPVVKTGTATADGTPVVTKATAGDTNPITGVITAVDVDYDALSVQHRPASTARTVKVADAPNQLFTIQADGAVAVTDIGSNADLIFTNAGNTSFGLSGVELDSTTFGAGATKQLKVHQLYKDQHNEMGANAILVVSINNHTEAAGKAGI